MSVPWTPPPFRPTIYNGIQMRSRLEAQTAADLDRHGITWKYEPWAYGSVRGQYLPDFLVYGYERTLVEVKGAEDLSGVAGYQRRMEIAWASDPDLCLLLSMRTTEGDLVTATSSERKWVNSPWQGLDIGAYFCHYRCQACLDIRHLGPHYWRSDNDYLSKVNS